MSVVISDAWRQRFGGTARLYGEKALQCFADAHVCVVGIGGVGSWAAEALARTGIGAITLIDMDDVCVTNTNRQVHALGGNVGLAKAEVMAERIRLINPECRVTVVDDFVTPENVAEYLGVGFSYVIDAIDSVRPKAALIFSILIELLSNRLKIKSRTPPSFASSREYSFFSPLLPVT